ncbi:hypothetical protein M2140_001795 [Clostridiales Family XIII bacterium PM5-7]
MGKYQKASEKVVREKEFLQEQKALHKKYEEVESNVVIKEKSNSFKFAVKTFKGLVQVVAHILLILLAIIGCGTLVYPTIRVEFLSVLHKVWQEALTMLGM